MTNTTPPSTALGRSVSRLVRNSSTTSVTATTVRFATCVRPFCPSRIWVLVGDPFTTNVPLRPAARLDAASPMMSRFTSARSPCLAAKLREVAALWAMMMMKHAKAVESTAGTLVHEIPVGSPIGGNPPWIAPMTSTP